MNQRVLVYTKAVWVVVLWGASFIATKVALEDVSPMTVVWLRFGMGVLIMGAAVAKRGQWQWPQRNELLYFGFMGFLGITLYQWVQTTGLITAKATTTSWIVTCTPIFIAVLGWVFLQEKLEFSRIIGILLAGVGVLFVLYGGDISAIGQSGLVTQGDLLILLCAPIWALFAVLSRRGLQRHPAARMMFFVMFFGWVFTTILFIMGPGIGDIGYLTLNGWLGVVFLGVFCSGLAYIYYYDALQVIPAAKLGVFMYIEPLVTMVIAAFMLGEKVLFASLVGGVIILLGVWMVNRPIRPVKVVAVAQTQ